MTKPRWYADISGHVVQRFSRDPGKPDSRLASRRKVENSALKDAKDAKRAWEAKALRCGLMTSGITNKPRNPETPKSTVPFHRPQQEAFHE
jgi:hypothetical protein